MTEQRRHPTWADARAVLCEWLEAIDAPVQVPSGRIRFLGDGLTYDAFVAECLVPRGDAFEETSVVIRVPNEDAEDDQAERAAIEQRLLRKIRNQGFPFAVPRPLGSIRLETGVAVIQELLPGTPVDLRWTRSHVERPWSLIGEVAAAVHLLPREPFDDFLGGSETRRDHAEFEVAILEALDIPEFAMAREWAERYLPPATPARLLHGDLLGQNILVPVEGLTGVIDWTEAFFGDPAFDIAIVTRGVKKPFQKGGGHRLLLDTYNERAQDFVSRAEVHLHEICLAAAWYVDAFETEPDTAHTEEQLRFFRALLRRVTEKHP